MHTAAIAEVLLQEIVAHGSLRQPEPSLLMTNVENVRAFHEAGRPDGALAPMRVYHALHVSELVAPGDTVLDLGCGPGDQLAMLARAHCDAHFVGVDLSAEMLRVAGRRIADAHLRNAAVREDDITRLKTVADASVDCVYSTVVLHHLADERALASTFREVHRVLKPGGRVYLSDFGRLRSERAMQLLADAQRDREPDWFVRDYLNSLRAAFSVDEWRRCLGPLAARGRLYTTSIIPFVVTLKSRATHAIDGRVRDELLAALDVMSPDGQKDLRDLVWFTRMGGLAVPALRPRASGSARRGARRA